MEKKITKGEKIDKVKNFFACLGSIIFLLNTKILSLSLNKRFGELTFSTNTGSKVSNNWTMCGREMESESSLLMRGRGRMTAWSSVRDGKYLHMVISMFSTRVARSLSVITGVPWR